MQPFILSYDLPLRMTMGDAGRLLLRRIEVENPLCSLKGLQWVRNNLYRTPSARELAGGNVVQVNILDPNATQLPQFDRAHLNMIAGGPYQVNLAKGYLTSIQEDDVKRSYTQGVAWRDLATHHQDCSQVLSIVQ